VSHFTSVTGRKKMKKIRNITFSEQFQNPIAKSEIGEKSIHLAHKHGLSQQPENCENRNDPDFVQAFLKKW
jgi:hypothetical protein